MSLSDADAYDRFMGRYSRPLAVPFADFADSRSTAGSSTSDAAPVR